MESASNQPSSSLPAYTIVASSTTRPVTTQLPRPSTASTPYQSTSQEPSSDVSLTPRSVTTPMSSPSDVSTHRLGITRLRVLGPAASSASGQPRKLQQQSDMVERPASGALLNRPPQAIGQGQIPQSNLQPTNQHHARPLERYICERYHAGGPNVSPLPLDDLRLPPTFLYRWEAGVRQARLIVSVVFKRLNIPFAPDRPGIKLVYRRPTHDTSKPAMLTLIINAIWNDRTSPSIWPCAVFFIRRILQRFGNKLGYAKIEVLSWQAYVMLRPEPDWESPDSRICQHFNKVIHTVRGSMDRYGVADMLSNIRPVRYGIPNPNGQLMPECVLVTLGRKPSSQNQIEHIRMAGRKIMQLLAAHQLGRIHVIWTL